MPYDVGYVTVKAALNVSDLQFRIEAIQQKIQREQAFGFVAGKCVRAFVDSLSGESSKAVSGAISKAVCKMAQVLDIRWFGAKVYDIASSFCYVVDDICSGRGKAAKRKCESLRKVPLCEQQNRNDE